MPTSDTPLISIVVATYNAARTLDRCLASVIAQRFRGWELIVVDGASNDGTQAIIDRYANVIAWRVSEPDGGIYDAWNKGISVARGEYVCFLGADDTYVDVDALQAIVDATGDRSFDLVSSRGRIVDVYGKEKGAHGAAWNFRRVGRRMPVCHPGLWHARALFNQYGAFDATYRITGDLDFLLRLPESTRALHLDRITVNVEDAGVSRGQTVRRLREQRRALANSPRFGPLRAWVVWLDKMWRYPVARLLGLPF